MSAAEVKVTIKDSDQKLIKHFMVYEDIRCDPIDPTLSSFINESKKEFHGDLNDCDITINIKLVI